MRCENCNAMQNVSYECWEWECILGIEQIEYKDGGYGCRYREKTINKMIDRIYESMEESWSGFNDFIKKEEKKDTALMQAIKKVLFSTDDFCICREQKDGTFNKIDVDEILKKYCWEIRGKYEDLLQQLENGEQKGE